MRRPEALPYNSVLINPGKQLPVHQGFTSLVNHVEPSDLLKNLGVKAGTATCTASRKQNNAREALAMQSYSSDPIMGKLLVDDYIDAARAWEQSPDLETKEQVKRSLARLSTFLYLRGAPLYLLHEDKPVESDKAYSVRMGPNTSRQLVDKAQLTPDDKPIEIFSGTGATSINIAMEYPGEFTAVDRFTPEEYDLERTHKEGVEFILSDIKDEFKVKFGVPKIVEKDARELSPSDLKDVTVVFADPAYGRDYIKIYDMAEADGFRLWVQALASFTEISHGVRAYSVIPLEWIKTLRMAIRNHKKNIGSQDGWGFIQANDYLNRLLTKNPYYLKNEREVKNSDKIPFLSKEKDLMGWDEAIWRLKDFKYKNVKETSKFRLVIAYFPNL